MKRRRMIAVHQVREPAETATADSRRDTAPTPAPLMTPDCPLCGGDFRETEPTTACPECGALYHGDCWAVNRRSCARLGCRGATDDADRSQIPTKTPDDDGGQLFLS